MEVKERRPYRSLTAARQDAEHRYTSSSADSEDGKPNAKSYSSSETLKAFDHDSRMAYGSRMKEMTHHEVDEFGRQGQPRRCLSRLHALCALHGRSLVCVRHEASWLFTPSLVLCRSDRNVQPGADLTTAVEIYY